MQKRIEYLIDLGVRKEMIGRIIERFPQIFGLDVENNLDSKIKYFKDLGFSREEIARGIETYTVIIFYSFEKRIVPRIELIRRAGIKISKFSEIYSILYQSDRKFVEYLEMKLKIFKQIEYFKYMDYEEFKNSEYIKEVIRKYKKSKNT